MENGHITEDRSNRKQMVDKRKRKETVIRENLVPLQVEGDSDPELLIVSWGSTKGAVKTAMETMREKGRTVGSLHLAQVWPLPNEELLRHLQSADRVVCVEGNVNGQLARLIRRETGFCIERSLLQYDGRPIMPEWILQELDQKERGADKW
jgi:2-oxoglutarate ferredoxin oxidoreductase subunit alpha